MTWTMTNLLIEIIAGIAGAHLVARKIADKKANYVLALKALLQI